MAEANESTEAAGQQESSTTAQPATQSANSQASFNLKQAVVDLIAQQEGEPRRRVVAGLAEEEISKRSELLAKAVRQRDDLEKEVKKVSKTEEFFHPQTRQPMPAPISKEKLGEIKKAEEKLAKLDQAIAAAIPAEGKPDWSKLKNLMGGQQ